MLLINKLIIYRTFSAYSTIFESGSPIPGHNLLYNSYSQALVSIIHLLSLSIKSNLVFLSNTISGIENYNITTSEERKRTMTKLSLIAGYKLQIIMVTLEDYKDSDTEYIKMPISKVKLDDIMVKYLN